MLAYRADKVKETVIIISSPPRVSLPQLPTFAPAEPDLPVPNLVRQFLRWGGVGLDPVARSVAG